jgi:hypothetical protein
MVGSPVLPGFPGKFELSFAANHDRPASIIAALA